MKAGSVWDGRRKPLGLRTGVEKAEVKLGVQMQGGEETRLVMLAPHV